MRIAIPYADGKIYGHFGHSPEFRIYWVEDTRIIAFQDVPIPEAGHAAVAAFLKVLEVSAVICGGIGGGAVDALEAAGMSVYGGCEGDPDAAVRALLEGSLHNTTRANCHRHEGGCCGDHGEEGCCCGHEGGCCC